MHTYTVYIYYIIFIYISVLYVYMHPEGISQNETSSWSTDDFSLTSEKSTSKNHQKEGDCRVQLWVVTALGY